MTLQPNSLLISLPGELRNDIFTLALCANTPVLNPSYKSSTRPSHHSIPPLGAALSQTCRAIYSTLSTAPLYKENTFVFTRVAHIHAFYHHLSRDQMRRIRRITIDLREAASASQPASPNTTTEEAQVVADEWIHYFACDHYGHAPGVWCSKLPTLNSDIPDLKELVLDLTQWQSPFAGSRKSGWKYMQRLLANLRGLRSIEIKGKCLSGSCWNPAPKPWGLGPWFSPAFCEDTTSLLDLLGATVKEGQAGERKVFFWHVLDGVTTLGVKTVSANTDDETHVSNLYAKVPQNGVAAWETFVNSKLEVEAELSAKSTMENARTPVIEASD